MSQEKYLSEKSRQNAELQKIVSELRQENEALHESIENYNLHFSITNDVMYSYDNEFRILNVSPNVERLLGYKPEEIIGRNFQSLGLLAPADVNKATEYAQRVLSGEPVLYSIFKFITKKGEERFGEVSGLPVKKDGKVVRSISVARDITKRVLAQEELKKYRDHLEDLVKKRTAELTEANEKLMREVEQREQSDEALLESKVFISGIADNIPGAVYQFYVCDNGEMGLHYVSDHAVELLGLEIEPLKDFFQRFIACVAPEDRENFQASIQEAVQNRSNWDHELRFIKSNGEEIYIRGISKPRQMENEVVFDGVMLDVTKRRLALKALGESEVRFRDLTENSADWIWEVDSQMRCIYASPRIKDILGYSPEEVIGKKTVDFLPPEEAEHIPATRYDLKYKPQPWRNLEYRALHKDGSLRILESNAIPIFDAEGRFIGCRGIDRDVTERKHTEHLLEMSQKKFAAAFYDSPAPMVITEAESGKTIDVNKAGVHWTGYSHDETIGLTGAELGFISPMERSQYMRIFYDKGSIDSMEIKFRTREGHIRDILLSARLIEIDNKPCLLSHLHDITDQRMAEEELKKHRDHLEKLVEERTADLTQAYERLKQEIEVRKAAEIELDEHQKDLEEMNAALKVILRQREEEKDKIEKNMMANLQVSILPYLEKLEVAPLNANQKIYLNILKSNLNNITSSFIRTISSEYLGFTPKEIQIASLIKYGKTSKEISELLNVSLNTIHTYRNRIRAKSGLKNKKVDLRAHLKTWK